MAPALRIPLSMPPEQLQRDAEKGISITKHLATTTVRQFVSMNTAIGAAGAATATATAATWGGTALKIAGSFTLARVAIGASALAIGGAIHEAKRQLEEMANVAEKSGKSGVSAEFWQQFTAEARKAKIGVDDLQTALEHAWQTTKDVLNPDWSVWDRGLTKITAVETALREMRELFSTDQKFTGLDLFRGATSQDDKTRAVLVAMTELEKIGQRVAALNLGEKMFGAAFADSIRHGKTSATELLATMERVKASGETAFSDNLVGHAKELDRQLKIAHDTLEQNLRPAWNGLADAALAIKSVWVEIVGLLAKAATLVSVFGNQAAIRQFQTDRAQIQDDLANQRGMFGISGTQTEAARHQRERRLKSIDVELVGPDSIASAKEISKADMEAMFPTATPSGLPIRPPFPPRRPKDAPTAPAVAPPETKDAFDREADRLNRHIALLQADAAAVGLAAGAHEQFRAELALLEAARKAQVEAGEKENLITDEQITKYVELRRSMSATQALTAAGITLKEVDAATFVKVGDRALDAGNKAFKAKEGFAGINDSLKFAGNQLVDVLDGVLNKTQTLSQLGQSALRAFQKELLRAAITGEGAFAKLLGMSSSVPGGTGGLLGLLAGLLKGGGTGGVLPGGAALGTSGVGHNAEGGMIPPFGLSYVGEHGPNPRLIRAGSEPIMVTPNDVVRGGGGGGGVSVSNVFHVSGEVSQDSVNRLERMVIRTNQALAQTHKSLASAQHLQSTGVS